MLLAPSGLRAGIPLHALRRTGQPLTTQNHPALNVNSVQAGKVWFLLRSQTGKTNILCQRENCSWGGGEGWLCSDLGAGPCAHSLGGDAESRPLSCVSILLQKLSFKKVGRVKFVHES